MWEPTQRRGRRSDELAIEFKVRAPCATYNGDVLRYHPATPQPPPTPRGTAAAAGSWRVLAAPAGGKGGPGRAEWCIDDCLYAKFAPRSDIAGGRYTSSSAATVGERPSGLAIAKENWELLSGATLIVVRANA